MGGAILDQLSVAADLMGAIDSGTGIVMAITIIYFCIYSHLARLMTPCSFFVNREIGQRAINVSRAFLLTCVVFEETGGPEMAALGGFIG